MTRLQNNGVVQAEQAVQNHVVDAGRHSNQCCLHACTRKVVSLGNAAKRGPQVVGLNRQAGKGDRGRHVRCRWARIWATARRMRARWRPTAAHAARARPKWPPPNQPRCKPSVSGDSRPQSLRGPLESHMPLIELTRACHAVMKRHHDPLHQDTRDLCRGTQGMTLLSASTLQW